jgi:hypothetical protein
MDADALERARRRLAEARTTETRAGETAEARAGETAALLERTRTGLEVLAETAAGLEASIPTRLGAAIEDALRSEVLPVARHVAEVRGLSGQTIRRLERLQADLDAERRARVEDLALLVDLVASGWSCVERRLDRIERSLERLERSSEPRAGAGLYPLPGAGA